MKFIAVLREHCFKRTCTSRHCGQWCFHALVYNAKKLMLAILACLSLIISFARLAANSEKTERFALLTELKSHTSETVPHQADSLLVALCT